MTEPNATSVFPMKSRETAGQPQTSIPSAVSDPIFERGAKYLEVNPERDLLTSHVNKLAQTFNADIFLEEGISLSGTHYGLNLICTTGVVLVTKDARILPSKTRPSCIVAQKFVNAGEAVLDRLQADVLVVLADSSKTIVGDAVWGASFVTTEKAEWRVQRTARKMAAREKRVDVLFKDAINAAVPDDNGFDILCRAQDTAIEAQIDKADETARPRLATVISANGA